MMMSQPRTRKAPSAASGDACRARGPPGKAAGDSAPCNVHAKQHSQRSRSKNKIPKSIRYDLENALVGLCDVWFEDIKPHLVRNNIKVHVHKGGSGGGGGVGAGEGGDGARFPPGAAGCSHLDPGTSAQSCELCRLLFNAANSIESAVSQAAIAALSPVTSTPITPPPVSSTTFAGNSESMSQL